MVVFNLMRFARDEYDHFALRSHLQSLGISLRSATEPIDDTSTGKLMEGVLAAFAQFDNDVRSDRTRAGMRAALELGRWVFKAPLGYLNAPRAFGKSAGQVWIRHKLENGVRHRAGIVKGDNQGVLAVRDQIRDSSGAGGHYAQAARHAFEQADRAVVHVRCVE